MKYDKRLADLEKKMVHEHMRFYFLMDDETEMVLSADELFSHPEVVLPHRTSGWNPDDFELYLDSITWKARIDISNIMKKVVEDYNSPEEEAKREAFYQEIKRIGELRKQAFLMGEPMDTYPLPWESKTPDDNAAEVQKYLAELGIVYKER